MISANEKEAILTSPDYQILRQMMPLPLIHTDLLKNKNLNDASVKLLFRQDGTITNGALIDLLTTIQEVHPLLNLLILLDILETYGSKDSTLSTPGYLLRTLPMCSTRVSEEALKNAHLAANSLLRILQGEQSIIAPLSDTSVHDNSGLTDEEEDVLESLIKTLFSWRESDLVSSFMMMAGTFFFRETLKAIIKDLQNLSSEIQRLQSLQSDIPSLGNFLSQMSEKLNQIDLFFKAATLEGQSFSEDAKMDYPPPDPVNLKQIIEEAIQELTSAINSHQRPSEDQSTPLTGREKILDTCSEILSKIEYLSKFTLPMLIKHMHLDINMNESSTAVPS